MRFHGAQSVGLACALLLTASSAAASPEGFVARAPLRPTLFAQSGYGQVLRAGGTVSVGRRVAVGGELILDAARFGFLRDSLAGRMTVLGAFKLKTILSETQKLVVALDFTPGVGGHLVSGPGEDTGLFALLLESRLRVGGSPSAGLTLGGSLSVPLLLTLGRTELNGVSIPFRLGPFLDARITDRMRLYGGFEVGPGVFGTDSGSFVDLTLDVHLGATYSF